MHVKLPGNSTQLQVQANSSHRKSLHDSILLAENEFIATRECSQAFIVRVPPCARVLSPAIRLNQRFFAVNE